MADRGPSFFHAGIVPNDSAMVNVLSELRPCDCALHRMNGSRNANASVAKNTAMKILIMPFCAYLVQISTTFLLSATEAFSTPSSLIFALINSTARYAPVVTACVDAPVNQ